MVAGGGSPCQGLSKLSSERKHFQDERSGLFFSFADRLDDVKEVCKELSIRFVGLAENVVMDDGDRNEGWGGTLTWWKPAIPVGFDGHASTG